MSDTTMPSRDARPLFRSPPVVLIIAGSDSGGGAGIQADLQAVAAQGAFGTTAITALTAQNTLGVQAVHPIPPEFVVAQMQSVASDFRLASIKLGMLLSTDIMRAIRSALQSLPAVPLVLDPVMVATSGARLLDSTAIEEMRSLCAVATLLTPNRHEASVLLQGDLGAADWPIERLVDALADRLQRDHQAPRAILLKDGHGTASMVEDLLLDLETGSRLSIPHPRLDTRNTHGTGCSLASAIAARLAHGEPLAGAVKLSIDYVADALEAAASWQLGSGPGPLNHFPRLTP